MTEPAIGGAGPWARFVAYAGEREPGEAFAVFRVALGLVLLHTIVNTVASGMVPVLWLNPEDGGYRQMATDSWLVTALGGPSPGLVWTLVVMCLLSGLALVLGLGGRWSALVALQAFMALAWINGHAGGSYDPLLTNCLWILFLGDATATLSLDCRLRTGAWTSAAGAPVFARHLVVVQLVLLYCSSGLQKVSTYWVPGGDFSALYYILQQPTWQRWPMGGLARVFGLTQLATASVWFFEVGSPLLWLAMWYRRTRDRSGWLRSTFNRIDLRLLFAMFGVSMHLGIAALMVVGPFSWLSISLYVCLFSGEEWRRRLPSWARSSG